EAWLSPQPVPQTDPFMGTALQDREKEMIEAALAESRGKVAGTHGAAARLGIPASTLDSKMKRLKISKAKFADPS
ncbi:MAG TPA: helix-turn-helix domain-containing protein, partial [Candidatus Polarisedimenticolia bacterium]|nr:helix-turn-helix domain-containing protein [Candidatus Polarisedimenticolia bacterium]